MAGKPRSREEGARLPNLRQGRKAPDPRAHLPLQRKGVTPQMIGRYPDFDVLDPSITRTWDDVTREVVESRLKVAGHPFKFFSGEEIATLRAFTDTCLAQDAEPRIPVPEMVDAKYASGQLDGYQYADMPDDRVTWHTVLRGLDEVARSRYGAAGFAGLGHDERQAIVRDLHSGALTGDAWSGLNVERAFSVCMRAMVSAFYSHPWAWNEIGFGGPAYPRGYMAFGQVSTIEPFEQADHIGIDPVRDIEERSSGQD
jgi:Gluconate 2-dehydrogenase subunit 3